MDWIQHHYELLGLVVAAIAAGIAWLQYRRKDQLTTSMNQSSADHSPVISGSNNSVIISHTQSGPIQPHAPSTDQAVSNLVFAGGKQKNVYVSPWPRDGISDPSSAEERAQSIPAFVLKIENRIATDPRKIARARNVIAKLKFRHKNGVTQRDIDYGVWLNSPCNCTDIGVGDTRELVLACLPENRLVTFEDRRFDNRDFYSEEFSYLDAGDIEGYEEVEIAVIDQSTQGSVGTKLKFWRVGTNFCSSEL